MLQRLFLAFSLLSGSALAIEAPVAADGCYPCRGQNIGEGSGNELRVSPTFRSFMRFDLSVLPPGTLPQQLGKATLRLYVRGANTPGVVVIRSIGNNWTEAALEDEIAPTIHRRRLGPLKLRAAPSAALSDRLREQPSQCFS